MKRLKLFALELALALLMTFAPATAWAATAIDELVSDVAHADAKAMVQAIPRLERAASKAGPGRYAELYFWLGTAQAAGGHGDLAQAAWSRGGTMTTTPGWAARCLVAAVLGKVDDEAGALAAIGTLEAMAQPPADSALVFIATLAIGDLLRDQGRLDDAQRAYAYARDVRSHAWSADLPAGCDGGLPDQRLGDLERLRLVHAQGPAEAWFRDAEAARERRQWAEAERGYLRVIDAGRGSQRREQSQWLRLVCRWRQGDLKTARAGLESFITANPSGPWRGQACITRADIALVDDLDAAAAARWLVVGVDQWLTMTAPDQAWAAVASELYLRMGILSWLRGDRPGALRCLAKVDAPSPSPAAPMPAGWQRLPTKVERLLQMARDDVPPAPTWVQEGGKRSCSIALALALIDCDSLDFSSAEAYLSRITDGEIKASPAQMQWALWQQAICRHAQRDTAGQFALYDRLERDYPSSRLRSQVELARAVAEIGPLQQEPAGTARLQGVTSGYAGTPAAETAWWYLGHLHAIHQRWGEARLAWRTLLDRHPDSQWQALLLNRYIPECEQHLGSSIK